MFTVAGVMGVLLAAGLTQAGGDKPKEKDLEIKGKFNDTDPRDDQRGGPAQTHVVKMKAGKVYTIDMVSTELDSYLRLLDSAGKQLDEDDDSGGNLNARIIFNCSKDGDYKVVCTTFAAGMSGSYTLTVKSAVSNQKPSSSHALMIGKAAPGFRGDFAIKGPALKLADLEGKVVLLNFCEVRSDFCAGMLPRLQEWHKAYSSDGLAIVAITFYASDFGQKLGFDTETGKVKSVDEADHKSDQAMLEAYAAHHKIEHVLMALAKRDALETFDAYAVNSVPQIVLIDRKGSVRFIHVGDAKSSAAVESELKKLLAEK
jgi:hypothetical protein